MTEALSGEETTTGETETVTGEDSEAATVAQGKCTLQFVQTVV
jgi:hypothetical protein